MRQTNGVAIAALIVGIVAFLIGWVPVFGLLAGSAAIALGVWALVKKQSTGMSISALVLGGVAALTSIVMTIVFAVGLANPNDTTRTSSEKPRSQTQAPQAPKNADTPSGSEVPDLAGTSGDEADDALRELGFETEFDAGDETVLMRSNWTVRGTTPAAGERAAKGSTVTIHVEKAQSEPVETPTTSQGLTGGTAWEVCSNAGMAMFPYGFRIHMTGVMADAPQDDVWFLKATITTENEFGNKRKDQVMECYVTGTDEAPALQDFLIY